MLISAAVSPFSLLVVMTMTVLQLLIVSVLPTLNPHELEAVELFLGCCGLHFDLLLFQALILNPPLQLLRIILINLLLLLAFLAAGLVGHYCFLLLRFVVG